MWDHSSPTHFTESPFQSVPFDNSLSMFRYNHTKPGKRCPRTGKKDLKIPRTLPFPLLEDFLNFIAPPNPDTSREVLRAVRPDWRYLRLIETTSRARPRLRRRLRALRPPRVFIRARNPCVLSLLRFRGLYVGFIGGSPVHCILHPETSRKR